MAEERVDIVVVDRVAPTIAPKLQAIATAASGAAGSVAALKTSMAGVSGSAGRAASAVSAVGASAQKTTGHVISLGAALRTMFIVYFAVAAAQRILNIADAYQEMSNKLRVVTGSADAAAHELDRLAAIAMDSRSSLDATVQLYQRLALAMSGMGVTGRDVEKVVENVNKALILGGADTQEATAAIRQLSQAFNKGKADGDEFRSMMENAPVLMDLVAKELGVARHELLGMAEDGKITANVMFKAFSDTESVAAKFGKTTLTLGQAVERLNTGMTIQYGKLQAVTRINRILAYVISTVAKNADILTASLIVLLTVVTVAKIQALAGAFAALGVSIRTALAGIGPIGWVVIGLSLAGGAAFVLWQRMRDVKDEAAALIDQINKMHGGSEEDNPFLKMKRELEDLIAVYHKFDGALQDNLQIVQLREQMLRKNLTLTRPMIDEILRLIRLERESRVTAQTVQDTYDATIGAISKYASELEGLWQAYARGYMSTETFRLATMRVMADLQRASMMLQEPSGLLDTMGQLHYLTGALKLGFYQLAAETPLIFQGIADSVTDALKRMTDGIGDLIAQWAVFGEKLMFIDVFRAVVAQMIRSLAALAAQYIAVGVARAFAGLGTKPALMTSGGGWVTPFGISGRFATGGFTGYLPTNQVAGIVHGQEFVVNARATKQNRGVLEAMNSGRSVMPNIVINNNAPGVSIRTESVSADEVRLIAEETVARSAGKAVAREMVNPNSAVSRSMTRHTTASRRGV